MLLISWFSVRKTFPGEYMLTLPALNGFQSLDGALNINVFVKQGANGPWLVPGIQLSLSPHQPQLVVCTQACGSSEYESHPKCTLAKFDEPS